MKYQLEITTLLVPVNVHQLFEKCEWPELNCFDREMVEGYFSDLVNGIQTDEALDDWTLTVVLYIGTPQRMVLLQGRGIPIVSTFSLVTVSVIPCFQILIWLAPK